MPLSDAEFEQILSDRSKRIVGDIAWLDDDDHLSVREFRVEVESNAASGLFVEGTWRPLQEDLFLVLVDPRVGRIAGLCVGFIGHRNPDGTVLTGVHMHTWRETGGIKWAKSINEPALQWSDPLPPWRWFCETLNIGHLGTLGSPEREGS